MAAKFPNDSGTTVMERRTQPIYVNQFLSRAKRYLEKTFFTKMQNKVWSNLSQARLGKIRGKILLFALSTN